MEDFLRELKLVLAKEAHDYLKGTNLTRNNIAANISNKLGREIRPNMLNQYLAESNTAHVPHIDFVIAFCEEVDSYKPLEVVLNHLGLGMVYSDERDLLEKVRIERKIENLKSKLQALEQ